LRKAIRNDVTPDVFVSAQLAGEDTGHGENYFKINTNTDSSTFPGYGTFHTGMYS